MADDSLPPHFADDPFLVREALPMTGRARLRRRDLAVPARGLRVSSRAPNLPPAERFVRLLGPDQHFSHTTAAAVWGLPVPERRVVHVTTRGAGPVMRRRGFVGHRVATDRARVTRKRGLPVTTPVDAWAECATLLTHEQLVILGDHLLWPDVDDAAYCGEVTGRGHSGDELVALVRRRHGRRGVRALADALADVRVGAQSPRETRLRLQLVREGIRMPLLNCEIHDRKGNFIARPDMVFGRERVCVEYDGDHHRTDRATYRNDKRRREALADNGWHTLSVSDDDLRGEHWVAFVQRLRRALARGEAAAVARQAERSA